MYFTFKFVFFILPHAYSEQHIYVCVFTEHYTGDTGGGKVFGLIVHLFDLLS